MFNQKFSTSFLIRYETSSNLRAFEKEEKEKKEKDLQKKNNSLSKTASYRRSVKDHKTDPNNKARSVCHFCKIFGKFKCKNIN